MMKALLRLAAVRDTKQARELRGQPALQSVCVHTMDFVSAINK